MKWAHWFSAGLLLVALVTGTVSDVPPVHPPLMLGGYHVLAADFHVHQFPLSWGTLAPWDLVLEARRQGLDAIAITGHNQAWAGRVGRWFSGLVGGPTVLVGEEIHPPRGHILAIGIEHTIDWRLPKEQAIDEVHRQGGVAIAAHPTASSWPAWSEAAVRKLDAVEVVHPSAYMLPVLAAEYQAFYERAGVTAIGDSDFHGLGPIGLCRTYVFAQTDSEASILQALRAGRTVVVDQDGRVFGNSALAGLAEWSKLYVTAPARFGAQVSSVCGILGLLVGLLFSKKSKRPPGIG